MANLLPTAFNKRRSKYGNSQNAGNKSAAINKEIISYQLNNSELAKKVSFLENQLSIQTAEVNVLKKESFQLQFQFNRLKRILSDTELLSVREIVSSLSEHLHEANNFFNQIIISKSDLDLSMESGKSLNMSVEKSSDALYITTESMATMEASRGASVDMLHIFPSSPFISDQDSTSQKNRTETSSFGEKLSPKDSSVIKSLNLAKMKRNNSSTNNSTNSKGAPDINVNNMINEPIPSESSANKDIEDVSMNEVDMLHSNECNIQERSQQFQCDNIDYLPGNESVGDTITMEFSLDSSTHTLTRTSSSSPSISENDTKFSRNLQIDRSVKPPSPTVMDSLKSGRLTLKSPLNKYSPGRPRTVGRRSSSSFSIGNEGLLDDKLTPIDNQEIEERKENQILNSQNMCFSPSLNHQTSPLKDSTNSFRHVPTTTKKNRISDGDPAWIELPPNKNIRLSKKINLDNRSSAPVIASGSPIAKRPRRSKIVNYTLPTCNRKIRQGDMVWCKEAE